ncbi:MAG: FtsX-like permease family protein [Alphaproteobacteria bacterium]|nr:MAG: FtsX-like permease family protein [Alphaproteobacteria bacterium]
MISLFGKSAELQLEKDVSTRYLPVVIAAMIFLAALAIGGLFSLHNAIGNWSETLTGNLTVEIAYDPAADLDKKVAEAVKLLSETPGVTSARAIGKEETHALLAPFLGKNAALDELPVPRLIEVIIEEGNAVDLRALNEKLAGAVPGASLDIHRPWLNKMVTLGHSVQLLAAAIMLLIGVVTVIIVIFAVRTGLVMHAEVIQVLHLIGAHDKYIAEQFQNYFSRLSFLGALPGLVVAVIVMFIFNFLVGSLESSMLPPLTLEPAGIVALLLLPFLIALLTRFTVRLVVMRSLARMM